MIRTLLGLGALLALAASERIKLTKLRKREEVIQGEYIVLLHPNATETAAGQLMLQLDATPDDTFQKLSQWNVKAAGFIGFAARMKDVMLEEFLDNEDGIVRMVEENGRVEAFQCSGQVDADWGLVRTTTTSESKASNTYVYTLGTPQDEIDVYIIDTGIYLEHDEFEGRATWGISTTGESTKTDENGHGTHVAGTVGGKTYGLAKDVNLIAVRVLNRFGSGTIAGIVEGVAWVAEETAKKGKTSIANMSLGGGYSDASNLSVEAAYASGVAVVVASGNSAFDACSFSPASAKNVVTVNAADIDDDQASFSNYGSCTDIYAPGVDITSAWIGSPTATNTISGTSMASPHVAGVAAKYLAFNLDASVDHIYDTVYKSATADSINNPGADTPNEYVFKGCDDFIVEPKRVEA